MEFKVPQPMTQRPIYTLPENPTIRQLRETAVKAMRDMLTIQWSTGKEIRYNKKGAVSGKNYYHDPGQLYCGLPYADGQTNLYVWLEHYNMETGEMTFDGDGVWLNDHLGNTCAGSLMWGWSAVCRSLTGVFINYNMVKKYGVLPVGDYKYNTDITTYYDHKTRDICDENGQEKMFECYAQIQLGDGITSTTTLHTMMSIIDAVVVRDENGKIDGEQSYITLQDQAAGKGKEFRTEEHDGLIYNYSGKINFHAPFNWLWEKAYIPITTAELQGLIPYEKAWVNFAGAGITVEQLIGGVFQSNYPMCLIKTFATDAQGNKTLLHKRYFNRGDVGTGRARAYRIISDDQEAFQAAVAKLPSGEYTLSAEVTVATGEIFTPVSFSYSK